MVVVDSGSTDRTVEYAKEFRCDTFYNPWPGFAGQRNWCLENVCVDTEWVLFVDADEIITPAMRNEISSTLPLTGCDAFYICYKVMLFGKWVRRSSNFPVWHPRIIRFGKARYTYSSTGKETWAVDGEIGYIKEPYIHYSFSKGLTQWFEKHNGISTRECNAFLSGRVSPRQAIRAIFGHDRQKRRQAKRALSRYLPCRPLLRFLYQLIIRGGVLDGPAGWTYCSLYLAYEIIISAKIKEKRHLERTARGD